MKSIYRCIWVVVAGVFLAVESGAFTIRIPGYVGPYEIKIQDFDNGTVYPQQAPGFSIGGSGNNVADATALDGLALLGPAGTLPSATLPGFTEDSWGIATVTSIETPAAQTLWQSGDNNEYLTAIFYGEVDTYFEQTTASAWHIDGVGLQMDLWEDIVPGGTAFDPTPGAAARTGPGGYTTATDGTLLLTTLSRAGFLHTVGVSGGINSEFESLFDGGSLSGSGTSYLDVTGGSLASFFDTNTMTSPASITNGVAPADIWIEFTTTPSIVGPDPGGAPVVIGNDWLVQSNDPVRGSIAVPEPASLSVFGLALFAWIARRRR